MKALKIIMAFVAISLSGFGKPAFRHLLSSPPGYALFEYVGGNPTLATSYSWVESTPDDCVAVAGIPCVIQGHAFAGGGSGEHPAQSDVNTLRFWAGPDMDMATSNPVDINVYLLVSVED